MKSVRNLAGLALLLALVGAPSFAGHLDAYHGFFELDGFQEVPPVNSDFRGSCAAVLDPANGNRLTLSCTSDVAGITAAHIHAAPAGQAGGVIATLPAGRIIYFSEELSAENAALAVVGGLYVNIHTEANAGGEIRGQIRLNTVESSNSLSISGGGASEVPPATTDATGHCRMFTDNDDTPTLRVVCVHDVENPTAAHIHAAPADANGGILFAFDSPDSPIIQTFDLTEEQVGMVQGQDLYVNIHSDAFPGGEVRVNFLGCQEDDNTLCLNNNRFAVTLDGTVPVTLDPVVGTARSLSADSGTFSLFTVDNKEVLIKVLNGCPINGNYWVFFAATTNVGFDLTVTDTQTGASKTYMNPIGQLATPMADTSAFATCP